MGIVTPTNKEVLSFKGLHLYHAGISNCAMRVRVTLEEKKLPWTSHYLDIFKKEHLTPEYFGINPKGVVPTLVDDGVVIVESDDIIDYLDKKFPNPPLRPATEAERAEMYEWTKLAVDVHLPAIKPHIYFHRVQKFMKQSAEEQSKYAELQTDKDLLAFHKKTSEGGFSLEEIKESDKILRKCFDKAEAVLQDNDWLVGDQFTLADISWLPNYYSLIRSEFSFEGYLGLEAWAQRISERDSYQKGILDWWPSFAG